MKAVVCTRYGGPDVLRLTEVKTPTPRDDEVLVRVRAVSLNDWDAGLLQGDPINRLLFGLLKPKRKILGSDIAGCIEKVGRKVTRFRPGDEVYGDLTGRWGGFAEYVCAPQNRIALKPPGMSFADAAALPQAGMLAVQGLVDRGEIAPKKRVLINGAGGGVGTLGVQIAKTFGVEVTGVDSSAKLEAMRATGFDYVIDYTKEDFTRNGERYDLILDAKTNRGPFAYLRALSRNGIYVTVGGSIGRLLQAFLFAPWIRWITGKRIRIVALKPNKDLAYLKQLYEQGKIKPLIEGPFSLEEVPNAFRMFYRSEHKGKIVITV
ncbi:MAG TPA: NAD(P)-dependent alcohol dehydrogenase [Chitinophagaceae bacterium]|nr:NAD(P)-dependent alcohol dehydrogenase [Chitinophagaceae bacterium]